MVQYDEKPALAANTISFFGEGKRLFGIMIVNFIFTILTLGIYYPWAKAATRKYIWNEFELNGTRLSFTGTGKEMFRGFIIIYFLVLSFYGLTTLIAQGTISMGFILIIYLFILAIIPLAIFGSVRYRVTRTSWRGIHFGFDGNLGDFYVLFLKELFLTLITLGIYTPWMIRNSVDYFARHLRIGDNEFEFQGSGWSLLGILLGGFILTLFTFYIYLPIFRKNIFNYYVNNIAVFNKEGEGSYAYSTLSSSTAWVTIMINGLLTLMSFGIYGAWAKMEIYRMYTYNLNLPETLDLENIEQSEWQKSNALGDQLADALDLDIGF